MTIGFLINTCEPFYRGGYERYVWAFARELARRGHDVRIYTSCPRDETIDGVRFVRLGRPRRFFNRRGVRNGWADVLFALAIARLLWKVRPGEIGSLFVGSTPFLHLPITRLVARARGLPVVLICYEALLAGLPAYVRERGHRPGPTGKLLRWMLAAIYNAGMGAFPRRVSISQQTTAALAAEGHPAVATVAFGLETEALRPEPPDNPPPGAPAAFVYCGRLTPIKSVDQTVRALLDLHTANVPFRCDIIGEGSERTALEKLVHSRPGAAESFRFHGEVSEETKRALLAGSEIFVLSSPREGFSVATLEAMAQGCAAVAIRDPARQNGALDFVREGEGGLVVPPGLEALRDALRRLALDADLRLRLRRGAWRAAQRYRIEIQAERMEEVCRDPSPGGLVAETTR